MGQGTHTAHAMIIAEELEVNINNISVETGIPGPKEYFSGSYNQQMTGANDGITNWLIPLSEIGARTRNLLIKAGAKFYGVAVDECHAEEGFVHHLKSNRKTSYGSLVDIASKIKPDNNIQLKPKEKYKYIGKPINRLDIGSKINGKAIYGTDVKIKKMLYAAVKKSPVFGGELKSYDSRKVLKMKGIHSVEVIPNGIAVIADSTWHAFLGLNNLQVEFEGGKTKDTGHQQIEQAFIDSLDAMGKEKINSKDYIYT